MTRGLAIVLAAEAVVVAALAVTALDVRAHRQVENLGGVNVWGYRGSVLATRRTNEVRIVITGGDRAFGWGVAPTETVAAYVRQRVEAAMAASGSAGRVVTTATAGALALPPADYASWTAHLRFLQADAICLLADPPDHTPLPNGYLPDRRSLVFRRFGYSPILPLTLEEKGARLRVAPVRAAGRLLGAIDRWFADDEPPVHYPMSEEEYVAALDAAARTALAIAPAGIVIALPAVTGGDLSDVPAHLAARFDREPRVRIVDLGHDPRLRLADIRLDAFNYAASGHSLTATVVAPAIIDLLRAERPQT
jgi:hypothetical protein